VTARMDPAVTRAITEIPTDAWTPIKYRRAIFDEQENRWVSDAEVAEIGFTAFTSHKKSEHIGARLIVRRVKRLNPTTVPAGQGELFSTWRHHAVFTDSAEPMLAAEATHRDHAIVEQVIADLKGSSLARMPSGRINANAAWLILAAIAFNLTRAAGTLASRFHAKATTATIRTQLITVPARIARSARRTRLHLPQLWPRDPDYQTDKASLEKVTLSPGTTRWSRGLPEQVGRRPLVLIMRRCLTLRTYAARAGARRRSGRSRVVRAFPWGDCGPVRMLTGLVISPGRPRG
jgi:hypothetical protein